MTDQQPKSKTNKFTYICAAYGVLGVALFNGLNKKLMYHGIYKHAFWAMVGAYVGTKYGEYGDRKHSVQDFLIDEYMDRYPDHPEFKKLKAQKPLAGEVLWRWIPFR